MRSTERNEEPANADNPGMREPSIIPQGVEGGQKTEKTREEMEPKRRADGFYPEEPWNADAPAKA